MVTVHVTQVLEIAVKHQMLYSVEKPPLLLGGGMLAPAFICFTLHLWPCKRTCDMKAFYSISQLWNLSPCVVPYAPFDLWCPASPVWTAQLDLNVGHWWCCNVILVNSNEGRLRCFLGFFFLHVCQAQTGALRSWASTSGNGTAARSSLTGYKWG